MKNKYQYYATVQVDKFQSSSMSSEELKQLILNELVRITGSVISYDFVCSCCEVSMGSRVDHLCSICSGFEDGSSRDEIHLVIVSEVEFIKNRMTCLNGAKVTPKIELCKFDSLDYDDDYQTLLNI